MVRCYCFQSGLRSCFGSQYPVSGERVALAYELIFSGSKKEVSGHVLLSRHQNNMTA